MFDSTSDRAIDWTRVERWAAKLVAGESGDMCAELRDRFEGEPTVVWNPQPSDIASKKLQFLLEYWTGLRRGAALPLTTDIDPMKMRRALGYVMLVDVVDGGRDFRYRLYGSMLASVSGYDMTGRFLSCHGASANVIEFDLAVYRAAVVRKKSVFTSRKPIGARYTSRWQRVAMPLVDQTGAVVRFLACTVPLSRSGATVSTGM